MLLRDIMKGLEHSGETLGSLPIAGITHDSRQVAPEYLFAALPGSQKNGRDFIPQALARGAVAMIGPAPRPNTGNVPYFEVDNPRLAYSRLAANFYGHPSKEMTIAGITGTNGKTTTTALLASILRAHGRKTAAIGTLGLQRNANAQLTGFTTPEANQLQRYFTELRTEDIHTVVMEVSSHALDQHRVDDIDFNTAAFLNLTPEHLDYHRDMESYLAAKLRLFSLLEPDRPVVVNIDDPFGTHFQAAARGPVITYSLYQPAALQIVNLGLNLSRTVANLSWQGQTFSIESTLAGMHNLENILAAAATALALEAPIADIQAGIARAPAVPGRLERIETRAPGAVFIDYAHTPDAYEKILSTIRQLAGEEQKLITFFGCGGDRDRSKRPVMAAIAEHYSDQLVITSDNPRTESLDQIMADILEGLSKGKHLVIKDRKAALLQVLGDLSAESILLILGKGREDYEIIGTEKIYHNDVEIVETWQP